LNWKPNKYHLINTLVEMKRKNFTLRNVWISAPMSLSMDTIAEFRKILARNFSVSFWNRSGSWDYYSFAKADIVVVLLPELKFKGSIDDLPSGVKLEIQKAKDSGKHIYLGYKASTGYHIYNCDINRSYISGISGTADALIHAEETRHMYETNEDYFTYDVEFNNWMDLKIQNPCAEIALPKSQKVTAKTTINPDFKEFDERLLLLL
jgi:hypothetical protein